MPPTGSSEVVGGLQLEVELAPVGPAAAAARATPTGGDGPPGRRRGPRTAGSLSRVEQAEGVAADGVAARRSRSSRSAEALTKTSRPVGRHHGDHVGLVQRGRCGTSGQRPRAAVGPRRRVGRPESGARSRPGRRRPGVGPLRRRRRADGAADCRWRSRSRCRCRCLLAAVAVGARPPHGRRAARARSDGRVGVTGSGGVGRRARGTGGGSGAPRAPAAGSRVGGPSSRSRRTSAGGRPATGAGRRATARAPGGSGPRAGWRSPG